MIIKPSFSSTDENSWSIEEEKAKTTYHTIKKKYSLLNGELHSAWMSTLNA